MTPDQIKADYRAAIEAVGELVVIRNYVGTTESYTEAIVRARVVDFNPDQMVGPIVQGDRKLIMLAATVDSALLTDIDLALLTDTDIAFLIDGITLTATQNCKVIVRGKELQIKAIDDNTRRVQGELIAYELTVGG